MLTGEERFTNRDSQLMKAKSMKICQHLENCFLLKLSQLNKNLSLLFEYFGVIMGAYDLTDIKSWSCNIRLEQRSPDTSM